MNISSIIRASGHFIRSNSNTILTSTAVAGVISTAIFAVRGTNAAVHELLREEAHRTFDEPDFTIQEKVKIVWPYYVPTAVSGLMTIGCIVATHKIGTRKAAVFASAYSISEKALAEYKAQVVDHIGETEAKKIDTSLAEKRIRENPNSDLIVIGDREVLCYDQFQGRYFKSDIETIRAAVNEFNAKLLSGAHSGLPFSDFLNSIGVEPSDYSYDVGWNSSLTLKLKYASILTDEGKPCLAIDYEIKPFPNYWSNHQEDWLQHP